MAFTAGTSNIKLVNIATIGLTSANTPETFDPLSIIGDDLKDGVSLVEATNSSIKVASGRERQVSEKVNISFEIIEITSADAKELMLANNSRIELVITLDDARALTIRGIINVNRSVKTNDLITYMCTMEVIGYNIDDITDYA